MARKAIRIFGVALVATLLATQISVASNSKHLLVLDFEIVDTSNEPSDHRAEHARRLLLIRDAISKELAARQAFEVVDASPIRGDIDRILAQQYFRTCNGCELPLAQRVGADFVMLGKFNKISTLIGSMDIVVKDAKTGEAVYAQTFGFRGDTDEAWLRAAKFFAEGYSKRQHQERR
jgi:hypothetical protein